jgi:siroheme synthase
MKNKVSVNLNMPAIEAKIMAASAKKLQESLEAEGITGVSVEAVKEGADRWTFRCSGEDPAIMERAKAHLAKIASSSATER